MHGYEAVGRIVWVVRRRVQPVRQPVKDRLDGDWALLIGEMLLHPLGDF